MAEEKSFFDDWLSSQKGLLNNWMDLTKKFQESLMGTTSWAGEGNAQAMQEAYNFYNSWIRTVGNFFDDMMKSYPIGVGRETFSRTFGGADAYMKLYDFWNSLYGSLRDRAFNMESYQDIFDSTKYKEIVDKVFGLGQPQTLTEFFGQASKLVETWGTSVHKFVNPWIDTLQKNLSSLPDVQKHPEAGMNVFHNVFDAFNLTFGKALKMPKVGKDREKIDLMMTCLDKCSVYMAKNTEFQYRIYMTGESAMKKVVQAIVNKIKSGDEIQHYDEFFKIWTDINEEEFFQLFQQEEFAKLQGSLLESALDARRHIHQLMELYLEDYPIALRSEMNDVYKTVYELKKKVRTLEKKLSATPAKEVTA